MMHISKCNLMYDLIHSIANEINEPPSVLDGLEHYSSSRVHTLGGGDAETHYTSKHALLQEEESHGWPWYPLEGIQEVPRVSQEAREIGPETD